MVEKTGRQEPAWPTGETKESKRENGGNFFC